MSDISGNFQHPKCFVEKLSRHEDHFIISVQSTINCLKIHYHKFLFLVSSSSQLHSQSHTNTNTNTSYSAIQASLVARGSNPQKQKAVRMLESPLFSFQRTFSVISLRIIFYFHIFCSYHTTLEANEPMRRPFVEKSAVIWTVR